MQLQFRALSSTLFEIQRLFKPWKQHSKFPMYIKMYIPESEWWSWERVSGNPNMLSTTCRIFRTLLWWKKELTPSSSAALPLSRQLSATYIHSWIVFPLPVCQLFSVSCALPLGPRSPQHPGLLNYAYSVKELASITTAAKQSLFRQCAVSEKGIRVTCTPLAYTPQLGPHLKKKKETHTLSFNGQQTCH